MLEDRIKSADVIEALNARLGKPFISGSDAHFAFEIGCCRTIFPQKITDLESLRKAILNGPRIVTGKESPTFVHCPSAIIGNYRTRGVGGIFNLLNRYALRTEE